MTTYVKYVVNGQDRYTVYTGLSQDDVTALLASFTGVQFLTEEAFNQYVAAQS